MYVLKVQSMIQKLQQTRFGDDEMSLKKKKEKMKEVKKIKIMREDGKKSLYY